MDIITYAMSRNFTKKSLIGLGAIIGSPCTIESIVHQDGVNKVTFKWTGTDGTVERRTMEVYDGTPIYVWEAGNTYKYGDLVIYESAFYRCIVANSDSTFDDTKWNEIGSPDGNYDIVRNKDFLPARFTSADRKMYFAYEEDCFYFWNGATWKQKFKVDDEINDTSTNPVQNKVIYDALDKKQDKLTAGLGVTIEYNIETHLTTIDVNNISAEELEDMWNN